MSGDKTLLYVGLGAAAYFLFFSGGSAPQGGAVSSGLGFSGGDGGLLSGGGGQGFQGGGTSGTASTTAGSTTGSNPLPNADGATTRDHRVKAGNNQSIINASKNPNDPNNSNGAFRNITGNQRSGDNPSGQGPAPAGRPSFPSQNPGTGWYVTAGGSATPLQRKVDSSGHGTFIVPKGMGQGGGTVVVAPRVAPPAVGIAGTRITQTTSGKFTGATQANGNYVAAKPTMNVNRSHVFNARGM